MMSADRLLAFAAMSFWLRVMPGPSMLFVIGRALTQGHRAALTTVVGNTLGACVLIVAVAFGVGAVVGGGMPGVNRLDGGVGDVRGARGVGRRQGVVDQLSGLGPAGRPHRSGAVQPGRADDEPEQHLVGGEGAPLVGGEPVRELLP
jgi:hypothetical protein